MKTVLLWLATTAMVLGGSAVVCYAILWTVTMLWLRPLAETVLLISVSSDPCP